jgi:alpha-tubulin suppressor-like RCC1 family protein
MTFIDITTGPFPGSDGTYAQWLPGAGGPFTTLSEYVWGTDPLGDAQYILADTPDQSVTFKFYTGNPPAWPRGHRFDAIRVVAWVRTTGASSTCKFRLRILGQDYDSADYVVTSAIYTEISWYLPTLPDGNGWSLTRLWYDYTGFELGLVFVSGDELRCTKFHTYAIEEPYPHWTLVSTAPGTQADWLAFPTTAAPWTTLQRYDGDESYCYSTTGGDISVFPHDPMGIPFPTVIDRVRVALLVKNMSSTPQTVTPVLRIAGVDYRGGCDTLGTVVPADSTWHVVWTEFITDPSLAWPAGNPAGGPWTQAQVNAAEIGFENTSGGSIRVTSLAMEVFLTPAALSTVEMYPTDNGFHTDFIPTVPGGAEAAWEDVDEEPPDDAASYIEASTAVSGTPQYCSFAMGFHDTVIGMTCSYEFSLVLKTGGTVWGWGINTLGQLGNGTTTASMTSAVQVLGPGGVGFLTGIIKIVSSANHVVALKNDGTVWCWGDNTYGQCGTGVATPMETTPVQVVGPGGVGFLAGIVDIAAGSTHSVAARNDLSVWCWGRNNRGQLGDNTLIAKSVPTQVLGPLGIGTLGNIIKVAAGAEHTIALDNITQVWCWGYNNRGQCGDNTIVTPRQVPVQVTGPLGVGFINNVTTISGGYAHTAASKIDGTVWCWGYNNSQQCGDNVAGTPKPAPVQVVGPGGVGVFTDATMVLAGIYQTLALKNDNTVWSWGDNTFGQLGDGTVVTPRPTPVQVKVNATDYLENISALAFSSITAVDEAAVDTGGLPWYWGNNSTGQLGLGYTGGSVPYAGQAFISSGSVPADERIYMVELTARIRLGNLPHSTAEIVPVLRYSTTGCSFFGKPITIEDTGLVWFDVRWNFYNSPYQNRWGWVTANWQDVLKYEFGIGVTQGDVLVSRVRAKVVTCRDYPAVGAPDAIDLHLTNAADALMIRSNLDGTLYAVTEFAVGTGGYDPVNPGTVVAVNPADVALATQVWRGPLTHVQYQAPGLPWSVQYWCRLPQGQAVQGIGEVGLYAEILWSPFPWEIGTTFLWAKQHMPLQTRHANTAGLFVLQVDY